MGVPLLPASFPMQPCAIDMRTAHHMSFHVDRNLRQVRQLIIFSSSRICHVADLEGSADIYQSRSSDRPLKLSRGLERAVPAALGLAKYSTAARNVGQHAELPVRSRFKSSAPSRAAGTQVPPVEDPWLRRTPVTYLQFRNSILDAQVEEREEFNVKTEASDSEQTFIPKDAAKASADATRVRSETDTARPNASCSASDSETSTSPAQIPEITPDTATCEGVRDGNGSGAGSGPDFDPPEIRNRYFPYSGLFPLVGSDTPLTSEDVIDLLDPFLVEGRRNRMEKVVGERTYGVVPVVEGLVDLGNVSAICRTAEALGFQSVQVISTDQRRRFKDNRKISMGTDKWLDLEMWEDTGECFKVLRARGYRIAVTHIAADTIPIYDVDWTIPTALVFGNEHKGISRSAIENSDIRVSIPMGGMVDSFNVSVAAGITLHHVMRDRMERQGFHGDLTPEERKILLAAFMLRHKAHSASVIEQLLSQRKVSLGQRTGNAYEMFLARQTQIIAAEDLDIGDPTS